MFKTILRETKRKILSLYHQKYSVRVIARQTGVSYLTVYGLTKLREKINPETGKPYASIKEYYKFRIKHWINPETGKPFKSQTEYQDYRARQKINPETRKPYASYSELHNYQAKQRSKRTKNKEFSNLLKRRLSWVGVNQSWLAQRMGMSREAISQYINGETIPQGDNLKNLLSALEIKTLPKTLEDLVDKK